MRRLARWWFSAAPPARLGAVRVLVAGYSLLYLGRRYRLIRRLAEADPKEFAPVGVVAALDRPLPPEVVKAATLATYATNAAVLVGWRHRWTGPAYAALLLWTMRGP